MNELVSGSVDVSESFIDTNQIITYKTWISYSSWVHGDLEDQIRRVWFNQPLEFKFETKKQWLGFRTTYIWVTGTTELIQKFLNSFEIYSNQYNETK